MEDGIILTSVMEITQAKEAVLQRATDSASTTALQMSSSIDANHSGKPIQCYLSLQIQTIKMSQVR